MATMVAAQNPFNQYQPFQAPAYFLPQHYQNNRGFLDNLIPSAYRKTVVVNITATANVTCTVSAVAPCRRRRDLEEDTQFNPTETLR